MTKNVDEKKTTNKSASGLTRLQKQGAHKVRCFCSLFNIQLRCVVSLLPNQITLCVWCASKNVLRVYMSFVFFFVLSQLVLLRRSEPLVLFMSTKVSWSLIVHVFCFCHLLLCCVCCMVPVHVFLRCCFSVFSHTHTAVLTPHHRV